MQRLLHALEALLFATFSALCIVLCLLCWTARRTVMVLQTQATVTSSKLNVDLDEAHRLILEAGLTAMEARKASAEERASLAAWNGQASQLMTNANAAVVSLQQTSDSVRASQGRIADASVIALQQATSSIAGLQPLERKMTEEVAALHTTTLDLNVLIDNPVNAKTLENLSEGSAALAATAKDGQQFTHALLHPTWPHKVYHVMLDVAHVFNPL